jgi:DNA-binding PadR family transcriptional regulator
MKSKDLREFIIRILKYEELSGYSVYKTLSAKGLKVWPNHVYVLLRKMEKEGLLKSRWSNATNSKRLKQAKKHLYSLSSPGEDEYNNIIYHSVLVLMERFFEENLLLEDLPFHIELVKETLGRLGSSPEVPHSRIVIASPAYDPLVCFPKFYYALSDAYSNSMIYVVKNPWIDKEQLVGRKNLVFLDGSRDDIPLKDNFADYLLLQGLPRSASPVETIDECIRVLKKDGCFFLESSKIMIEESKYTDFLEFVLKMFYDFCAQDQKVSLEELDKILSERFEIMKRVEVRNKFLYFCGRKRVI